MVKVKQVLSPHAGQCCFPEYLSKQMSNIQAHGSPRLKINLSSVPATRWDFYQRFLLLNRLTLNSMHFRKSSGVFLVDQPK